MFWQGIHAKTTGFMEHCFGCDSFAFCMKQSILFQDLGNARQYQEVWELQEQMLAENCRYKAAAREIEAENKNSGLVKQSTTNYLLFVEHSPVYTLGKSG